MSWLSQDRSTVVKNRLKAAFFLPCSWEAKEEVFTNHLKPTSPENESRPILSLLLRCSFCCSHRATVAVAVCRRTVWWISKPKAYVCILIIAGSLVSPLKQPEYSEWTTFFFFFQRVAWVASEAIVLIEKLITSEAFMLMYVVWQKPYNKRLEEGVPVPWYQTQLIALS